MNLRVRLSLFIHLSLYLWHTIKMDSNEIENNLRQIITVLRYVVSRICIFGIRIVSFFSQICKSILYYILYLYKYNILRDNLRISDHVYIYAAIMSSK